MRVHLLRGLRLNSEFVKILLLATSKCIQLRFVFQQQTAPFWIPYFLVASTHDGYKKSLLLEPHGTGRPPPAVLGFCSRKHSAAFTIHQSTPRISQGTLHHACLCVHHRCPRGPARACPPHVRCHGCEGKVHHRLSREPDGRGEVERDVGTVRQYGHRVVLCRTALPCSSKAPGMH